MGEGKPHASCEKEIAELRPKNIVKYHTYNYAGDHCYLRNIGFQSMNYFE